MKYEKVTIEELKGLVVREEYYRFPDSTHTVCCLYLKNGFSVIGTAACLNPEDYDQTLGRQIAYDAAIDKMWALQGYARMSNGNTDGQTA